jgi:4-diphosphocytidyl-2-C-methyl-D-erythritol kinase
MSDPMGETVNGEANAVEAPAKINLFLLVGGKRTDGYHPLCSLMEKVTLFDRISVKRTGRMGVRLLGMEIPVPGNTVFRAAMALEEEAGVELDVEVILEKQIPEAAGLAGGSSDAAAILVLLDKMFNLQIPSARLSELALRIGADVPFFLEPGPLLAEGVGDMLSDAVTLPDYHAVIVKSGASLSTAEVYELYDSAAADKAATFPDRRRVHLERLASFDGSIGSLAGLMQNDLEIPALRLCDDIGAIKDDLLSRGAAGALMSGSGPSVFGLFAGETAARAAYLKLAEDYQDSWLVHPLR